MGKKSITNLMQPKMFGPKRDLWAGWKKRICIAVPTTGLVRVEWMMARFGQVIPCNWSNGDMFQFYDQFSPMGWAVADARNICVEYCLSQGFEWCFKGDTEIETELGVKCIKDIKVGEMVKTHKGRYRPVLKAMKRPYGQGNPLVCINTPHSKIRCTPEHPFMVLRQGENKEDVDMITWTRAESITSKDKLLYPSPERTQDFVNFNCYANTNGVNGDAKKGSIKNGKFIGKMEVDRGLAYFFGLYLAEGNCEHDGIRFTFNNNESEYIDSVKKICEERFGRTPTIYRRWATSVKLNIRSLSKVFGELFGTNARMKKIPSEIYAWSLQNRLAFIKGYLDGDGSKNSGVTFNSASKELVNGLETLCIASGISIKKYGYIEPNESRMKDGTIIKNTGAYYGYISKSSYEKILDLSLANDTGNFLEVDIVSVEQKQMAGNLNDYHVYNLEVEDDNSYIAQGVIAHNCFFIDHDVILPPDTYLKINEYMTKGDIPVVSGLYYCKGSHPEPLVFRGRGNGCFTDWKPGEKVWADGIPMGCTLIHASMLRVLYDASEVYTCNTLYGPVVVRRVFETPREAKFDPEKMTYERRTGTEDLFWCDRMKNEKVFEKCGVEKYKKFQKKKYPFLIDTSMFCKHIDENGKKYP